MINSQLNRLIHEINAFARINFWIFEFYHKWCALKSPQISAFSGKHRRINFRLIVYSWSSPWFFSLYILKIMKFSTFDEISSTWMSESFDISYLGVQFIFEFFEINAIVRALKFAWLSLLNAIFVKAECEIEILSFSIHDSCNNTIFAFLTAYSSIVYMTLID